MAGRVIARRVIERTDDDLHPLIFGPECTGRFWTQTRDPFLFISEDGEVVSLYKKKARKLQPTMSGSYHAVGVGEGGKTTHIHRLMMESWYGPPPFPDAVVRHLDGDRFNNRLSNLAWGTHAENSADMVRHGTVMTGERNPMAKLTYEKVGLMRARRSEGASFKEIADEFGVTTMTAHRAVTGRSWNHGK